MDNILTTFDFVVFFGSLLAVMGVGLWVARRDGNGTADYYLASKDTPWWAVAGSIFGSNVSANHMVGMMAVGFGAGFVISHFEITAIAGLLLLCYFFLPVYRKLHVFTLSDYLSKRFDDRSRVGYSVIMLIIIVLVMMLPAFYMGSRAVNILMVDRIEIEQAQYASRVQNGGITSNMKREAVANWEFLNARKALIDAALLKDGENVKVPKSLGDIAPTAYTNLWRTVFPDNNATVPPYRDGQTRLIDIHDEAEESIKETKWKQDIISLHSRKAPIDAVLVKEDGEVKEPKSLGEMQATAYTNLWGQVFPDRNETVPPFAEGAEEIIAAHNEMAPQWSSLERVEVSRSYYILGIIIMALVTGAYTIVGGLRAVIITDVIQTALIILAMLVVAWCTFNHNQMGGWEVLMAFDTNELEHITPGKDLMHLYKPMNDPKFPWTGMLTGVLVLHFYYWGANQFIVQRALSARSLNDARIGIITAGFFKLLIPFLSIGTGIAAYYLFQQTMPGVKLAPDTAFPVLMREVVAPLAIPGLVGLVAAGLIGAILSSVDSMMNSAATLVTFDFYKRFINPKATEEQLVRLGKYIIGGLVFGSAFLTILVFDPNTNEPFMQYVISHQSKLVSGIVAAFVLGMLWSRTTAAGGFASILTGVAVSYTLPLAYASVAAGDGVFAKDLTSMFGTELNAFHSVFVAFILALLANILVSKLTVVDEEKAKFTWTGLNIIKPAELQHFGMKLLGSLLLFAGLGAMMSAGFIAPVTAGILAAIWTFMMFLDSLFKVVLAAAAKGRAYSFLREDRFWAGLLAACAVFMMFYFK